MKKLLSVLFFFLGLINLSLGQTWTRMQGWGLDLESSNWITNQKVVAVGENLIIYSENAGVNWVEVVQEFEVRFSDVTFSNESIGIAVGDMGTIFRSTDGGKTWTKINSGTAKNLKSVVSISETQLFATGEDGTLLSSSNSGSSWSLVTTNSTLDFQEIFFVNENLGFIAAQNGHVFRSSNKGVSWEQIQLATARDLNGILFTSPLIGYAVGDQGTFFRTTDGGNTWASVATAITTNLKKLAASPIDNRILVALGDQARMIRSINSGTSFTSINLGAGNIRNLNQVGFIPGTNTVFAFGQNGYIISSTNAGTNWTTRQAGIRNDFSSTDFKSNTVGFISGKNGEFYVTTNGGVSLISRPIPERIDIHTIDFWNTAFGYVSSESGKMYRTANSGVAWVPVPSQTPNKITGFYLFAPSVLYISGTKGYVSRSFDSGVTWDQSVNTGVTEDLADLTYFDFVFGFGIGKNGKIIWTAGGTNWETKPKLTSENLNALAKLDTTTAIVVGNNGVVLRTKDKAVTWEILPFPEKVNLTSVDFWDLNLGFVVGEKGVTFQTKDGGMTWFKINSGTVRDLKSVNYGNPNSAFAVGSDGTILSYSCTPPGGISPINGSASLCLGKSVYTVTSQPELSSEIVWRVDGGIILTGQGSPTIEIEWTTPGRNAVLVSRSNFCGTGETSFLEVQVNPQPAISAAISGEGTVCTNSSQTYTVPSQLGNAYTWEISGGEIKSGQGTSSISVLWTAAGDQMITVYASSSCGKSEPTVKSIKVNKAPEQPAAILGEAITPLGQFVYQTTAIPGLNYRWNISGGGKIISGQGTASITVNWEQEGQFEVSVEAQNECNFGPKRVFNVNVNIITALEPKPVLDSLIVYPNPSNGKVTIQSATLDAFESLQVINSLGQVIYRSTINQGDKRHDIELLPRGAHYIQLSGKNGVAIQKVLVR
jgi:photosystem II stability/assembly factor-like uncharacterized protein